MTEKIINNLKIIEEGERHITPKGQRLKTYILICFCGKEFKALKGNVDKGHTKSCGCMKSPNFHGLQDTPIHNTWDSMIQRCTNIKNRQYRNYGARGIKVCDDWRDFMTFYKWSIVNYWAPKMELDRIDNDGDYTPSNCRWVTHSANNRNKRNNRLLTYNGETKTIVEWSEITGLSFRCIQGRVDSLGWSVEKTLTTKSNKC